MLFVANVSSNLLSCAKTHSPAISRYPFGTPLVLLNAHRCLFQFLIDLTAAHINCDAEWFLDSIFEFDLLKKQKILLPNYISRLREVLLSAREENI